MMAWANLSAVMAVTGPQLSLPGPYWLFTILHWLTFSLHLIAMNVLFGGLLVLIIAGTSPLRKLLFETQVRLFPTAMAATITLGVAPLLFLQAVYGEYFYSATIVSAWNWYLIIPVVLVAYSLLYVASTKNGLADGARIRLLIPAVVGFVYVSYTFTMISDLGEKPQLWAGLYHSSPAGLSLNPSVLETIFRWLHIVAGALAVNGMAIQFFALYRGKVRGSLELLRFGGRIYMLGVVKATVLGLIYLFTLDSGVLNGFLRSPGVHAILGAIVLNIIALAFTYTAVTSPRPHLKVWVSAVLVFGGVFCMVMARHLLRLVYLGDRFDPAAIPITPQWSVFAVFVVCLAAGLATLFWMIRRYFAGTKTA